MNVFIKNFCLSLAIASCLMSCGNSDKEPVKPVIAVSVAPQAELLETIAGDDYDIVTVLENGANPETFEPGMNLRIAIDKAQAYFTLGDLLPFEKTVKSSLGNKVRIVDTCNGLELAYGTHVHHHNMEGSEQAADPHVWTSVINLAIMVDNMSEALGELRPEHRDTYAVRADSILARLDSIDEIYRVRLASAPTRTFAVWHPSLSYFARDYGLRQIAFGQEHKELSAMRLKELIDSASHESTRVFFFQREYDSRQAETANARIGSRLVCIDPLSADWEEQMNIIVNELTRN